MIKRLNCVSPNWVNYESVAETATKTMTAAAVAMTAVVMMMTTTIVVLSMDDSALGMD